MSMSAADASNKLEDLSGATLQPGENPYSALIDACHHDPVSRGHLIHVPGLPCLWAAIGEKRPKHETRTIAMMMMMMMMIKI